MYHFKDSLYHNNQPSIYSLHSVYRNDPKFSDR